MLNWTVRFGLTAALVVNAFAYAEPAVRAEKPALDACADYLSDSHYEFSHVLAGNFKPAGWALKPEPGSIEDKRPGVVAQLVQLRYDLLHDKKRAMADGPVPAYRARLIVEKFIERLVKLQYRNPEPRLQALIDGILPFMKGQMSQTDRSALYPITGHIVSKLWELTVACFFDGQEIRLGQSVAALFPQEYAKESAGRDLKAPEWTRELDIVIRNWDGSWRWIEVKDWDQHSSISRYSKSGLAVQSLGQDHSRHLLHQYGHKINLMLVLKYGVPEKELREYRQRLHYDGILFVYPEGHVIYR
jgi:hypothetical protein